MRSLLLLAVLAFGANDSIESCRQQTTVKLQGRELVVTLGEAQRIKAAAEKYLVNSKLQKPGPLFIDCEGVVRMGAWILESSTEKEELRLTLRTVWTEHLIVREEMRIRPVGNRWRVMGMGRVTYHGRY